MLVADDHRQHIEREQEREHVGAHRHLLLRGRGPRAVVGGRLAKEVERLPDVVRVLESEPAVAGPDREVDGVGERRRGYAAVSGVFFWLFIEFCYWVVYLLLKLN